MNDIIMAIKNKYNDPYLIIGGDFNRRNLKEATREYPEVRQIITGPTRADATLDIIATNFNDSLEDSGLLDPVFNLDDIESDHKTVFAKHRMPKVPSYDVQDYSYFHLDKAGDERFGGWLRSQSWREVLSAGSPSLKVEELHRLLQQGMSSSYEWKTRKKNPQSPYG